MRVLALIVSGILSSVALAQNGGGLTPDEIWELAGQLERRDDPDGASALFAHLGTRNDAARSLRAAAILRHAQLQLEAGRTASARLRFEFVAGEFPDVAEAATLAQAARDAIPADAVDAPSSVLDGKVLGLEAEDAGSLEIARILSQDLQLPVVADGGAEEIRELRATLSIRKKDAGRVVRALARETGTAFVERRGVLVWTTRERAERLRTRPVPEKAGRNAGVAGDFLESPCATLVPLLARLGGIDLEAPDLPGTAAGVVLGSEARILDVLDLIAFQLDRELVVIDGRVTLRADVAK